MNLNGMIKFEQVSEDGGGAAPAAEPIGNILAGDLGGDPEVPVNQPSQDAAVQTPQAAPSGVQLPENWKEALPEDLRSDPSLQTILKVEDLAKSYLHSRKQIGADKLVLPTKHATPDEWREVYQKLGLPEKLEEYDIEAPEGNQFQDGFITEMKKIAHEAGVLPQQMQQLLGKYSELNNEALQKHEQTIQAQMQESLDGLKRDWGNAYEAKLRDAKKAYKFFGQDPGVKSFLEDMGQDADFVRLLSKIGAQFLKEDSMIADGVDTGAQAPGDASKNLNEIYSNPKHPYWDKSHPNHQAAVQEVEQLNRMAFPQPQG